MGRAASSRKPSGRSSSRPTRDRVAALWDRVRELHPYEVPEFIVLPIVDGNEAYLRWVGESTGAKLKRCR